jgi:hypothetical protein
VTLRALQKPLFVLGGMTFGASLAGLPVLCWAAVQPFSPGLSGAAAGAFALIVAAGLSLLGALVGLIATLRRLRGQEPRAWTRRVWCGIALGILTGLALHAAAKLSEGAPAVGQPEAWPIAFVRVVIERLPGSTNLFDLLQIWPIAAILTGACGAVGGVAAWLAGWPWDRSAPHEPPRGDRPPTGAMS